METRRLAWWKLFAVWGLFLALHFSFETFPNTLFRLIGEDGETTFFHMKMLFFAYVFVTLVELAVRRGRLESPSDFVYSRALIAVAYPWLTITMWFAAEALGIAMRSITVVILYANITTALGIYLALRMEEALDPVRMRASLRAMVVLVFCCAVLAYASFSFKTPMPFFVTPPGF